MKLIEKYILKRLVTLFFSVLGAALIVSWTVEMLSKINFAASSGNSLYSFMIMSILFIPSICVIVMPFALAIATSHILNLLNQDSEMVIITNASSSRVYIWRPIIIIAILTSLSSFFIANFIVPDARHKLRFLISEASASFLTNVIQENEFFEIKKNLYIKIGERNLSSALNKIFIADERNKKVTTYYYAKNAAIIKNNNADYLVMNNGTILRHNLIDDSSNIVKFNIYNISLTNLLPAKQNIEIFPKDLSLSELYKNKQLYAGELHYRLTSWLFPLIFALIALYMGGHPTSHRKAKSSTTTFITSFFIVSYYLIFYIIKSKSESNSSYALIFYLLIIATVLYLFLAKEINYKTKN